MSRSPDTTIWRRALMEEAVAFDAAAREYVAALNDKQPGWPRLLDVSERILLIKLGILDPATVVDGPHHMHGHPPSWADLKEGSIVEFNGEPYRVINIRRDSDSNEPVSYDLERVKTGPDPTHVIEDEVSDHVQGIAVDVDPDEVARAAGWIRKTFGLEPPKDILTSASLTPESTRRRMQAEIEHAAKNESGSPYSFPTWTGEPFYDRETGFVASGTPTDAEPTVHTDCGAVPGGKGSCGVCSVCLGTEPTVPKGGGEDMTTEGSQKSEGEENREDGGAARTFGSTYADKTGRFCPDAGTCHHDCEKSCWRVHNAAPLSITGWEEGWPASIVEEHRKREATRVEEDAILSYTPPENEREEAIEAIEASMQKVEKPPVGMLRFMPTHDHSREVVCGRYCPVRQWDEHKAKWGDPYEKLAQVMPTHITDSPLAIVTAASGLYPVGAIVPEETLKLARQSYLLCDGSTFDKDKHHMLFQVLGNNRLPDLRAKVAKVGLEAVRRVERINEQIVHATACYERSLDFAQGSRSMLPPGTTRLENEVKELRLGFSRALYALDLIVGELRRDAEEEDQDGR